MHREYLRLFSLNTETGQVSVNGRVLAFGVALTNLPRIIEESAVVVEVRLKSPTVYFTILPYLSTVALT